VGAEVEAPARDDIERLRIDLHEPPRVVGHPDRPLAEGDALRASEAGNGARHSIRRRVDLRDRAARIPLIVIAGPDEAATERND
jgi:hypothetical protein